MPSYVPFCVTSLVSLSLVAVSLPARQSATRGADTRGADVHSVDVRIADALDSVVATQMARREIPGLSLAIIDDGRIVETRVYGTTTRGGTERVTPSTLFQAGSISKPVSALAALKLVQQGALTLDTDVNTRLVSWHVPDNEFTQREKVTLRRLLSHTAGLTVHGFPGYAVGTRVPSVPEVLDGKGNTGAVRVNVVPGSIWRYSGGGYTVMQQLVTDVTRQPFARYLQEQVLKPLGMTASSFQQPLPASLASRTAGGQRIDRQPVPGRWHVYPEMAAAGLWTTPSDLARYAIGVQQMMAGTSKVLSANTARQMLTEQKDGYGLGPGVADTGAVLRFSHGGRDEGFDAFLVAYAHSGDGAVVMINANDNSRAVDRVINAIAQQRRWPAFSVPTPERVERAANAAEVMQAVAGRYEFQNNNMLTLFAQDGKLFTDVWGLADEEWIPSTDGRVVSAERSASFRPIRNTQGVLTGITWIGADGKARDIPRIGPLFGTSTRTDPDASFTGRMGMALEHLAMGGTTVKSSPLLTEGAREVFTRPNADIANIRAVTFVATEDVNGRGIARHGHAIARVLHYRLRTDGGERLVILHVDAQGRVADFDVVSR